MEGTSVLYVESQDSMDDITLKRYINRAILQLKFLEVNINNHDKQTEFIDTINKIIEIGLESNNFNTILETLMYLISFYYRFVEFEYENVKDILDKLLQGRSVVQIHLNRNY
jgi:hypothetical protein